MFGEGENVFVVERKYSFQIASLIPENYKDIQGRFKVVSGKLRGVLRSGGSMNILRSSQGGSGALQRVPGSSTQHFMGIQRIVRDLWGDSVGSYGVSRATWRSQKRFREFQGVSGSLQGASELFLRISGKFMGILGGLNGVQGDPRGTRMSQSISGGIEGSSGVSALIHEVARVFQQD